MKRMSEIFELPCSGVDIQGSDVYYSQAENEVKIDDAIAHSINHVDALADALGAILSSKNDEEEYTAIAEAQEALKAYRGEK